MNQLRSDHEGSANVNGTRRQHKSNNISEQAQVTSRLHQIRDHINQTTSVMERLQAAGTPVRKSLTLTLLML